MKTNFKELNNASEACPVKKRNIVKTSSKENFNYRKAIAKNKVIEKYIVQKTLFPLTDYIKDIAEEFEGVEFPSRKTHDIFVEEASYQIRRYHEYIIGNGINPIYGAPSLNIKVQGTDVEVSETKPTYVYVKQDANGEDEIHVVKVSGTKPSFTKQSVKQGKRKDLYLLAQYGRVFIPAGKKVKVFAEYHFLRSNNDTQEKLVSDYDDSNIIKATYTYGKLPSLKVCKQSGLSCPCMASGLYNEMDCPYYGSVGGCYCESMKLQNIEDITMSENLLIEEECSEEDCKNCTLNDICNYKHSPLYVPQTVNVKGYNDLTLNDTQEQAVGHREGLLTINAGAGAGKTVVIAARVACMLAEGISGSSIILFTFTKEACKEMTKRIRLYASDLGVPDEEVDKVTIVTFNAFGQLIVDAEWENLLGYNKKPILIDDVERYSKEAKLLDIKEVRGLDYRNFNSIGMKGSKGALEQTKKVFEVIKANNLSDNEEGRAALIDGLEDSFKNISDETITDLFELYDKYFMSLKNEDLIEFADQENLIFEVLRKNPYYFEDLGYEHILIDEAQDTSSKEYQFVKELVDTSSFKSIMVVGDDSQTIYEGMKGADAKNFINIASLLEMEDLDTTTTLYLTNNYRSTPEIIKFVNGINSYNKNRIDKDLVSAREHGVEPEIHGFWTTEEEDEWAVEKIKELIGKGKDPADICYIAPVNERLSKMASMLAEEGIATAMLNPEPVIKNSRVKGALALARYLQEPTATLQALIYAQCLLKGELLEMTDEEVNTYIEGLSEIVEDFNNLKGPKQKEFFFELLEKIDEDDEIFQSFIETLKGKNTMSDVFDYCALFEEYGGDYKVRRQRQYEGVALITAHSSKGLEWPIVINSITGYYNETIDKSRIDKKERKTEEKRRLFFVSASRARDELYVTGKWAINQKKDAPIYNPFLREAHEIMGLEFKPVLPTKEEKEALKKARQEKKEAKKHKLSTPA